MTWTPSSVCVRCGHPPSDHINPSEHFKPTPGPPHTGRCLLWGCGCPGYRYALDETREAA